MQDELRKLVGLDNPEATPIEILKAFGRHLDAEGIEVETNGPLFVVGSVGPWGEGEHMVEVAGLSWGLTAGGRRLHIWHGHAVQDEEPYGVRSEPYEGHLLLKMGGESFDSIIHPEAGYPAWLPSALVDSVPELIERLAYTARKQASTLQRMGEGLSLADSPQG